MTDTEIKRRKAICEVAGVKEIDDVNDGFHTFRQLYYQRMMLFATIVKQNRDRAWKSLRHENGKLCFGGGWFIVGIDTPEGSYTYHYENNYFSLFDCVELECSKHWDGHTEKDVTRLLSLPSAYQETDGFCTDCSEYDQERHFCPRFDRVIRKTMEEMGIIHCKDCKHWDKTWTNDWAKDYHYCPMVDGVRKASFYCADAERRIDDEQ